MRALSVIAVVLAHAGMPGLAGGFVGVDIFFVISGFLITRLMLAEFDREGTIDLMAFWARRCRRLLPNAFAALLGTMLLALFLFPVSNPADLVRDITFAALEVVNFQFANRAVDYFQADAPASPILHFWSLSVEEQFYLVWPIILFLIGWTFPRWTRTTSFAVLVAVWCASFALCVMMTNTSQPDAYFSTGTRIWQLATGAMIAIAWLRIEGSTGWWRVLCAWLGAAAIAIAIATIDEASAYPGSLALLPTLGAAGLIAGFGAMPPAGLLRSGLGHAVMQWIGARSYSFYLWHLPMIALPKLAYPGERGIELAGLAASFVIACAAYRWIELPVREARGLQGRPARTIAYAAASLLVLLGIANLYWSAFAIMQPERAGRIVALEAAAETRNQPKEDDCHLNEDEIWQNDCRYGDVAAERKAVVFGDSHSMQWFDALNTAARRTGWQLQSWTKSACPSADVTVLKSFGVVIKTSSVYESCREWYEDRMAALTGPQRPDLVILSNSTHYPGQIWNPATEDRFSIEDGRDAMRDGFRNTIERLRSAGVRTLVIRDIPVARNGYRSCFIAGKRCTTPEAEAFPRPDMAVEAADDFPFGVQIIDLSQEFCRNGECAISANGVMMYRDKSHFSVPYAAQLAPHFLGPFEVIARALDTEPPITGVAAEASR